MANFLTGGTSLSIEQIRRRVLSGPLSLRVLSRLKRDGRRGVRKLCEALEQRHAKERGERLRIDRMLDLERVLWRSGIRRIAGVDEVGVGPLAGPVVAAAVVFPPGAALAGVDDSKRLGARRRQELAEAIRRIAVGVGIGLADVAEIDRLNVYHASLLAMRRAVEALPQPPEHLLVDARTVPGVSMPQNAIEEGDGIDFSIAAASIVAKTHRDALMEGLNREYPGYGFARHKGYGTAEHQAAIRRLGPCAIHRMSYSAIGEICGELSPRFYELKRRLKSAASRSALREIERAVEDGRDEIGEPERRKLRVLLARRWNAR